MANVTKLNVPKQKAPPSVWRSYLKRVAGAVATGMISAAAGKAMASRAPQNVYYNFDSRPRVLTHEAGTSMFNDVDLRGRGKYTMRQMGRDIYTGAGAAAGGALGAMTSEFTGPYGAAIGGTLGAGIGTEVGSAIFGRGKYSVSRNTLALTADVVPEGLEVPSFTGSKNATRIRHREFIQDILVPATPAAFTNRSFVLNPGNALLFPWLAPIAAQYQQYEFMGLVFYFKTTSSDYAANGPLGTLVMATNYDVLEAPYFSKLTMENSQYSVSAKPSVSQVHAIECDPSQSTTTVKYVRDSTSSTTASQDNRFYDHGLFQIATTGLAGTTGNVLGELWVTYDIKLLKPEISTALFSQGQMISSSGGVSTVNIFGNTPVSIGLPYAVALNNTLTFTRPGSYLLSWYVVGTGLVDTGETASAGFTLTQVGFATGGNVMCIIYNATVTAPGQSIVFNATVSTTLAGSDMRITPNI